MSSDLHHPDELMTRPPTPKQAAMLRQIVATNGGGVSAYGLQKSVLAGLVKRHLVQGKSGNLSSVVHTDRGLKWVRDNQSSDEEA